MQLLLDGKSPAQPSFVMYQLIYPAITLWSVCPLAALWSQQRKDTTSRLSRQCTDPHPHSLVCPEMYLRAKKTPCSFPLNESHFWLANVGSLM